MNIIDYLKWRGDLSLKVSPFNEVDNLCICGMFYTRFDYLFEKKKSYTLAQLSNAFFETHYEKDLLKDDTFIATAPFILKLMGESTRFKDAKIHSFKSYKSDKENVQFAAASVDLSDGTTYIIYRGTDDSLTGWSESFYFTYKYMPTHKLAVDYLKKNIKPLKRYRIGGHSKGGTLATYAVMNCPGISKHIVQIYSNDGPGLKENLLPKNYKETFKKIKDKYCFIVPEFDFFGTIFPFTKQTSVIKSNGFAILQHDYSTWQVERDHFVKGELNYNSKLIKKALKDFFDNITDEQLELFVDELKKACEDAGLTSIKSLSSQIVPVLSIVIKKLPKLDDNSRQVIANLIKAFVIDYKEEMNEDVNVLINRLILKSKDLSKDVKKKAIGIKKDVTKKAKTILSKKQSS